MINILYYVNNEQLRIVDDNDVIDDLYYQKARVPTVEDVKKYLGEKPIKEIKEYFKGINIEEKILNIKRSISKIDYKVPLYDEYKKNVYIINRNNVYSGVIYKHYRFPDERVLKYLRTEKTRLKCKRKNISRIE